MWNGNGFVMEIRKIMQKLHTDELLVVAFVWDVYDWNVASRFDEATFSWMELMVFVSHGCQLFRLLWISPINVFIWWFKSWLRHCDSTSSNFVWANCSSSSLICFSAFSNGSSGPKLLTVCLNNVFSSPLSLDGDAWSKSAAEHDSQCETFTYIGWKGKATLKQTIRSKISSIAKHTVRSVNKSLTFVTCCSCRWIICL